MEIGEKIIKGMYCYDKDITFTNGDFIVENSSIYIVISSSVKGISPSQDVGGLNYKKYLAEDTLQDIEELKKYLSTNEDIKDKLLTGSILSSLLSSFLTGFDDVGIINNEVTENGDAIIRDIFNGTISSIPYSYSSPLDKIMTNNSLNNCIFTVNRSQAPFQEPEATGNILLRQTTYKSGGLKKRVQELIDIDNNIVRYRYGESPEYSPKPWRTLTGDVESITTESFLKLINGYEARINELHSELIKKNNRFYFSDLTIQGINPWEIDCSDVSDYITLSTELTKSGSAFKDVRSITIKLDKDNITNVIMFGEIELSISLSNSGTLNITRTDRSSSNFKIICAYGKHK